MAKPDNKPEIIGPWHGAAMDEAEAFIAAEAEDADSLRRRVEAAMKLQGLSEMPGSLNGRSLAPLCADHQPVADLVEIEGVQLVQFRCPNCGWCMYVHPQFYADLMTENAEAEPIDILKHTCF